jgi:hypothetical protein
MKRIILLSLLVACGTARAAEWVSVGFTGDNKQDNMVDVSSIRIKDGLRYAWVKVLFAPHTEPATGIFAIRKFQSYQVYRLALNCAEATSRNEFINIYFEDGSNASSSPGAAANPWVPVTPDTVTDGVMKFVCAWKAKNER